MCACKNPDRLPTDNDDSGGTKIQQMDSLYVYITPLHDDSLLCRHADLLTKMIVSYIYPLKEFGSTP